MAEFYDALETRDPAAREKELFARLPEALARAMSAPGWAEHLKGVDPKTVTSRAAHRRATIFPSLITLVEFTSTTIFVPSFLMSSVS